MIPPIRLKKLIVVTGFAVRIWIWLLSQKKRLVERSGVFLLPKSMVFGLLCRKGEQNTLKGEKDDKLS